MAKKLPIFYSALLLTAVNLFLRFVSTSFQVHISSRIGPAGVGLLQLVLSVGSLAMTAGMAGIRTATMYVCANALGKHRENTIPHILSTCFLYSIVCSSVVAVGMYLAAPLLAQYWIGDLGVVPALQLFAVCLPIVCLTGCMTGYFTAANRIGTLAVVEIGEQICYMAVTMGMLIGWAGTDAQRCCLAVVAGSGIGSGFTLVSLLLLLLLRRPQSGGTVPVARTLLQIALPLALADDVKVGINTAENLMVPKRLLAYSGALSPLAAFGMVTGMVFPVLMFPAAILFSLAELLIPELARCMAAGSSRRVRYLTSRGLKASLLYGFLCGGLLYLLADTLCLRLYGSTDAASMLRRFALLAPMLYCDALTDAMTKGLGQQKVSVRYNICTAGMDVLLLYILLPRYGMDGYFFSFFVTHLLNFLLSLRLLLHTADSSFSCHVPLGAGLAVIGAIGLTGFVPSGFGRIPVFLILFFTLLGLLSVISREELHWCMGLLQKRKRAAP